MRKLLTLVPVVCLALASITAKAETMLTDGTNGNIGPYSLTLSPGGTILSLFCLDFGFGINTGETWSVTILLGSQLSTNSLTDTSAGLVTQYEEEAYILSQLGATYNDTDVQNALWKVFDPGLDISGDANAVTLYNAATGAAGAAFIADGGYDNYVYYIYNGDLLTGQDDGDSGSPPQNFLDPTPSSVAPSPEPSSLLLLGSGLIGLAGVARRKLVRK